MAVGSLALLLSALGSSKRLSPAIKSAPVMALLGLTVLGVVSLSWSVVDPGSTILVALTPAAYAGVVVFAACEAGNPGRSALIAIWIATLATVAAVTGLIGVLFEVGSWAILLGGRQRPAGFVEYPPALALLQLGAMTTLARGCLSENAPLRGSAGAALMIGAVTVLLAQSRAVLAMACLLAAAWLIWPEHTLGVDRRRAVVPASLWAAGGLLLIMPIRLFDPWPAAIVCLAVVLILPWLARWGADLIRSTTPAGAGKTGQTFRVLIVLVLSIAALGGLAALTTPDRSSQGVQGGGALDHGRIELWSSSLDAIGEKPLLGQGQGSFLAATADQQDSPVRFAHNLIVESAVELGVAGALLSAVVLLGSLIVAWKRRLDPLAWLHIPMIVGFCVLGLVDWVWYLTGIGAIWALCLGCILLGNPRPGRFQKVKSGAKPR